MPDADENNQNHIQNNDPLGLNDDAYNRIQRYLNNLKCLDFDWGLKILNFIFRICILSVIAAAVVSIINSNDAANRFEKSTSMY